MRYNFGSTLVVPSQLTVEVLSEILKNDWMDFHDIWYTCSRPHQDEE